MNHLATARSPYLRQHEENPVDWYPWGDEAFERAREEDKPLFVSIGYAACHWCHVMAHESFEDRQTAADLDRWFVSVKVDREERPDVDAVYMAAVQTMTGSGGWPMSVFCTPDGRPFFGGTYFPPTDRQGMPSFRRVLSALADAWETRRDEVEQQADALVDAIVGEVSLLDRLAPSGDDALPATTAVLSRALHQLGERFDPEWGGFLPAPKFPRPSLVELCLRHHRATADATSLEMACATLDAMAAGGLYDHLAGGFARYSTDREWLVPHFEKLLPDQALLARVYLRAWLETGRADYLGVATETLDYVLDHLAGPGGGLCSSEDADSAGVEGAHATFTADEARRALLDEGRPDLVGPALDWYGITETGNWEGTNVLRRPLGAPLDRPPAVEEARRILLASRLERPRPGRDDKVLTEWNAMAIAALAEAAAATGSARWAGRAEDLADLLFAQATTGGRWRRVVGGDTPAFAADYAWVVECCTRLAELTGQLRWATRACTVADEMLDLFWDSSHGGLHTTGADAERLVVRGKEVLDGATPSANSVAAVALLRLGALVGEERFAEAGRRIVELEATLLSDHPIAVADLVPALALTHRTTEVLVAGDRPDLLAVVRSRWLPDAVVAWGERSDSPLWEGRRDGAAYVCTGYVCAAPAADPGTLASQLDLGGRGEDARGE